MKFSKKLLYIFLSITSFLLLTIIPLLLPFLWIIGERLVVITALVIMFGILLFWVWLKIDLQIPTTEYQQKLLASIFILVFFCSTISFTLRYLANVENYIGTFELPAESLTKEINKDKIEKRFNDTREFIQRKFEE